jgi:hypothetical protein
MERTPSSSASPKRCGYMTAKGKKCKNPSESCRFHCGEGSAKKSPTKSPRGTPKSGKRKSGTPGKSLSPGRSAGSVQAGDIKILLALPIPYLHDILLQSSRDELHQLCEAASKMRIRGELTNIEKLCRNKGFQNEYNLAHPYKKYPNIFAEEIREIKKKYIMDTAALSLEIYANHITLTYFDGYEASFTMTRDGSWLASAKAPEGEEDDDLYPEATIEQRIGRPKLFSRKVKERTNEVNLLLKQMLRELERKYWLDKIRENELKGGVSGIRNFFKKFGV